jgi:hypothetical protein
VLESVEPKNYPDGEDYMNEVNPPPTSGMTTIGWVSTGSSKLFVNRYGSENVGSFRVQSHKDASFQSGDLSNCFSHKRYKKMYDDDEKYTREDVAEVIGVAFQQDPELSPQENLTLLDPMSQNFAQRQFLYVIIKWKHLRDPEDPDSNEIHAVTRQWWRDNIRETKEKKVHTTHRRTYYFPVTPGKNPVVNKNGWADNLLYKIACHKEGKYFKSTHPGEPFVVEREPSPFDADLPGIRSASMGLESQPVQPGLRETPSFQTAPGKSPSPASRMPLGYQTPIHRQESPGVQMVSETGTRDTARFGTPQTQFGQAQQPWIQPNAPRQTPDATRAYAMTNRDGSGLDLPFVNELNELMEKILKDYQGLESVRRAILANQAYTNPMNSVYSAPPIGAF